MNDLKAALLADIGWQLEAECRGMPWPVFFPPHGKRRSSEAAKAVCARCPVKGECLEYALSNRIEFGIWGGTADQDRRKILRARRAEAKGRAS